MTEKTPTRPYVAVRLDLDPDTCGILHVVDGRGGESLRVDARTFTNAIARIAEQATRPDAARRVGATTVALPVELYTVASLTCFPDTARSVLEVLVEHLRPLGVAQIVMEPAPGPLSPSQRSIDLAAWQLRRRTENAEAERVRIEDLAVKARLRAAAAEGWLEQVSENMRAKIVELGLDDTPPDDGDQQPTVDTRLAVLVAEIERLRDAALERAERRDD